MLAHTSFLSPVGVLKLVASGSGLVAVRWDSDDPHRVLLDESVADETHPILHATQEQLREYFASQRLAFDLPLDFKGTSFQVEVWQALRSIPFGQTRSYGELARELGRPLASRAVGAANGRNPLPIIVPCHRVIGASGKLTGFAGGLSVKQTLLRHEQRLLF